MTNRIYLEVFTDWDSVMRDFELLMRGLTFAKYNDAAEAAHKEVHMLTHDTDTMRAEIAQHIEADAVRGGHYWDGQTGCFIGCLARSSRAETLTDRFGLPLPLVRICEAIFERLPYEEQPAFFREVGEALRDGQDLSRVHWAFLADTLRHLPDTDARNLVATVIDGIDRLARGDEWPEAARAEAEAWAAEAATEAAWAAGNAHSVWEAEVARQRQFLLDLLRAA